MYTAMEGLLNSSQLVRLTIASCTVALILWRALVRRRYLQKGVYHRTGKEEFDIMHLQNRIILDWRVYTGAMIQYGE